MAFKINWLNTVDSTNSEAIRQFKSSDDFTVFASSYQTSGRGQKGTSWESEEGKNLTFSIVLKPESIKAEKQFVIAQVVTIGIKRYLLSRGLEAKIKWPNDIYIKDKKICGILIEHFLSGDTLSGSIVGIGLNVNQSKFVSDAPNPVSMRNLLGREFVLEEELEALVGCIYDIYYPLMSFLSNSTFNRLDNEYRESLYRLDEFHKYEETPGGNVIEARITGIDENACLLLEKEDGTVKRYHFKEIKYLIS
ncbi:MAG: biotin--[acetyl-CoA-carboxylase] ligase [Bacteroidia bacterium]|jgi:BirA family biotin operon repressor/biotin-[acetyl-CoA-carboxylase] ligase|nr:biotin--[acetyl-CoA-carboxylase] ligase [Rikenellaceae bacterium]NCB18412.1 biotin--[acetyl-CoA-carboxylase] ligase [Bacteroidia bacterium]